MHTSVTTALEQVLTAAAGAARPWAATTADHRARALEAVADALDAHADELVPLALAETHLPPPRLRGELARTTFQLRLLADRVRSGLLGDVRIDHADPAWPMGPRPDLRRTLVPLGPVVVFAASNFPFAFSVAGGDTASALAAGCPVVVKAHPGHPELSRATASVVTDALRAAGAPDGVLGLVEGVEVGVAAVQDPRVKAVGFTGSLRGGRHLFDLAQSRPVPIPFYGELGSTNPVVVTPAAWRERGETIAAGLAASFTLGAGQFCTNPGVVLVPDVAGLLAALPPVSGAQMLTPALAEGFVSAVEALASQPGVEVARRGDGTAYDAPGAAVLTATGAAALAHPVILSAECFGPSTLLVGYRDREQLLQLVDELGGQLTATVQAGGEDDTLARELVPLLAEHAGRVLWNDWPTGVTVSDAQHHGGPYPASTASATTSVGTAAVARFLRPVAFQGLPDDALPQTLRDGADGPRLVDGRRVGDVSPARP